jgi:hypothetical protein
MAASSEKAAIANAYFTVVSFVDGRRRSAAYCPVYLGCRLVGAGEFIDVNERLDIT